MTELEEPKAIRVPGETCRDAKDVYSKIDISLSAILLFVQENRKIFLAMFTLMKNSSNVNE